MGALDKTDLALKRKIADRITMLRVQTGKGLSKFAKDTLKDRQSQHRWEKGRGASIYTINKFCLQIGISLRDFWNDAMFDEKTENKD